MSKDNQRSVPQVNLGMNEPEQINQRTNVAHAQVSPDMVVPSVPASNPALPPKRGIESGRGYVRQSQGYPVQPGQTWHDLTHQERVNYMTNRENVWKKNFGMGAQSMQANLGWTRG